MRIFGTAPSRISFFGGGTDLPVYYQGRGGMVISMAVDIYQMMDLTDKKEEWRMPVRASKGFYQEIARNLGMVLPQGFWAGYGGIIEGGLGASASAAVLMTELNRKLSGKKMTRSEIAETAWDIEVNRLKLYGGKQDQYAAAHGGMNIIYFKDEAVVDPFERGRAEELIEQTLLFYIGETRRDSHIQEELLAPSPKQIESLNTISVIAEAAIGPLWRMNWERVAELLDTSWRYKVMSNPRATTPRIDEIHVKALEAGAIGGKLCGSGGGGYMIFMGPPEKHSAITDSLVKLGCQPKDFNICWNGVTSKIMEK